MKISFDKLWVLKAIYSLLLTKS